VKIITLLAVAAILLVDVFGSKSSVGGPMTDLLVTDLLVSFRGGPERAPRDPDEPGIGDIFALPSSRSER
jgi:hypothetical protein